MEGLLFAPPIVFLMFIAIFFLLTKGVSRYSYTNAHRDHGLDPYACGQQNVQGYVNPDYSQFFPFAFFYTIMHVLVLVVATAPYDAPLLPVAYIACGILALAIIFKR